VSLRTTRGAADQVPLRTCKRNVPGLKSATVGPVEKPPFTWTVYVPGCSDNDSREQRVPGNVIKLVDEGVLSFEPSDALEASSKVINVFISSANPHAPIAPDVSNVYVPAVGTVT
jgi:hypothetical protein